MVYAISHRFTSLLCFLAIIASSGITVRAQPQQGPQAGQSPQQIQTLAVVNGQPITRQQVASECMKRFGEDVLQSIVNKQLVLNECRRQGLTITEKDVNDEIVSRAKKFGMSDDRYIKLICTKRNISVDRFKNDFIWNELALRRLAASNLQVSPEELNERMEFEFGPKIQVREIAVDSQQRAEQILAHVTANPDDFGRLAKDHSVDPNSASVRGLLPPIRRNSGLPQFENIAFSLQPGQISNVFQIQDKYIILKCERVFPAVQLTPEQQEEVHQRLIEEISNEKLATAASSLFEQLQQTVKVTNVMNDPQLSKQMPGIAAMVDQTKITKRFLAEECIARFGRQLLETEIHRMLLIQALQQSGMQVTENDVSQEITRAATAFGYLKEDGSVDIDQWLNLVTRNDEKKIEFYVEDEVWPSVALKKLVQDNVKVTPEDLAKGFEANFGPRVEVLAIVCNDHRHALKVWQMATANPDQEYFGKLANQYSNDPASKANFGQVPPIQKHGGRPELEKEAFSLQSGEISKVVQVGEHWVIMYCQGRTTPRITNIDDVRDELRKDIHEKKLRIAMAEQFEELRENAQIDNFLVGTSQAGAAAVRSSRQTQTQESRPGQLPFRGQR